MRLSRKSRIAVCSRSFSRNPILRAELSAEFDDVKFNESGKSLAGDDLVEFLKDCDGAIIALEQISKEIVDQLPELKVIGKYGVGLNNIDLEGIRARDIRLGWTSGVNANAVAELTLAMALILRRRILPSINSAMDCSWSQVIGRELSGATVGVIGCGHVGSKFIQLLQPFEVEVSICDVMDKSDVCTALGAKQKDMFEVLSNSDVITIHTPLTEATRNLIGATEISLIKHDAILINTARGGIVDEGAALSAISKGSIGGFGTDVLVEEPPVDMARFKYENVIVTSHVGGSSVEAILAMGRAAINGLLEPKPVDFYKNLL